jgi:hypothetical protein
VGLCKGNDAGIKETREVGEFAVHQGLDKPEHHQVFFFAAGGRGLNMLVRLATWAGGGPFGHSLQYVREDLFGDGGGGLISRGHRWGWFLGVKGTEAV